MKLRTILSDIFVGIPGGLLILMGLFMFNALLSKLFPIGSWTMLVILCLTAFIVGVMARWMRPIHGMGSAIASGVIAALILAILWLTSPPNRDSGLAIGPPGMAVVIIFTIFGSWVFARLRRSK